MTNDRTITATLGAPASNGRMLDGKKEQTRAYKVVAMRIAPNGEFTFREPVTARFWMSRSGDGASPVYGSLWASDGNGYHSGGHGKASGYGYHKASAALSEAIRSAGIKISAEIDGVGDDAMERALLAIARAVSQADDQLHIVRL